MRTRPVSDPAPIPVGISILCALALLTGWLVLRGASFAFAIPANAALVTALRRTAHPPASPPSLSRRNPVGNRPYTRLRPC